jgi:hypothetical protein
MQLAMKGPTISNRKTGHVRAKIQNRPDFDKGDTSFSRTPMPGPAFGYPTPL